jgi:hypothetical protein
MTLILSKFRTVLRRLLAVETGFNRFVCFPSVCNHFPLDGVLELAELEHFEVKRHLKTYMDIHHLADHIVTVIQESLHRSICWGPPRQF